MLKTWIKALFDQKGRPSMYTQTAHQTLENFEKIENGDFFQALGVPFGCTYWGWGEASQMPQYGISNIFRSQLLTPKTKKVMVSQKFPF